MRHSNMALIADKLARRNQKLREDDAERVALGLKRFQGRFSGHRMAYDSSWANWVNIPDPGNGNKIVPSSSGFFGQCPLTIGTGSETRTLIDPDRPGLELVLTAYKVGNGGSAVLTANTKLDSIGDTTITFNKADQTAWLVSVPYAGNTSLARWEAFEVDQALLGPGQNFGGALRQATNFAQTSQATLQQDTGLTFSNLQAGQAYIFSAMLMMTTSATPGIRLAVGGTATATSVSLLTTITSGTAVTSTTQGNALATAVTAAGATTYQAYIDGVIVVNAGGTFGIQFAQSVSNGSASTIITGSYITLTPVA